MKKTAKLLQISSLCFIFASTFTYYFGNPVIAHGESVTTVSSQDFDKQIAEIKDQLSRMSEAERAKFYQENPDLEKAISDAGGVENFLKSLGPKETRSVPPNGIVAGHGEFMTTVSSQEFQQIARIKDQLSKMSDAERAKFYQENPDLEKAISKAGGLKAFLKSLGPKETRSPSRSATVKCDPMPPSAVVCNGEWYKRVQGPINQLNEVLGRMNTDPRPSGGEPPQPELEAGARATGAR